MEVITIEKKAFDSIINGIEDIKSLIKSGNKNYKMSEHWIDIQECCQMLHVSKRTLQNYRDLGTLSFSQIGGKIYFRVSDIEAHLQKHYKNK